MTSLNDAFEAGKIAEEEKKANERAAQAIKKQEEDRLIEETRVRLTSLIQLLDQLHGFEIDPVTYDTKVLKEPRGIKKFFSPGRLGSRLTA